MGTGKRSILYFLKSLCMVWGFFPFWSSNHLCKFPWDITFLAQPWSFLACCVTVKYSCFTMFSHTGLGMTCYLSSAVFQSCSLCWTKRTQECPPQTEAAIFSDKLWNEIQCMHRSAFALLCSKCWWLQNPFDLWSLSGIKQTMQSTKMLFKISLSSPFFFERTPEELVACRELPQQMHLH